MAAPALTVSRGLATARICQISYDVASLAGNLVRIRTRDDAYAVECRRELVKIHAALVEIEQHVAAVNGLDGEAA